MTLTFYRTAWGFVNPLLLRTTLWREGRCGGPTTGLSILAIVEAVVPAVPVAVPVRTVVPVVRRTRLRRVEVVQDGADHRRTDLFELLPRLDHGPAMRVFGVHDEQHAIGERRDGQGV